MSSCVVISPLIVASWPFIASAVTAACGSLGFAALPAMGAEVAVAAPRAKVRADIPIEDSEILQETGTVGGEIVVERAGIRATFSRDARGALKLCMEGQGHSQAELKRIGEELIGRVTQQYAYHKIISEAQRRNMAIVDEQVGADQTVKIRIRQL